MKVKFKDIYGEPMTEDLESFIVRRLRNGYGGVSRGHIEDLQDEVDRLRTAFTKLLVTMIEDFEPKEKDIQDLLGCGPFEFVNEEDDET